MTVTMTVELRDWREAAVKAAARNAIASALTETATEAVTIAQANAPRDTGFMANTIEVVDRAQPGKLSVTWGNITADYTLWQEIGSQGRAGRYFLRGAAERAYPGLLSKLRNRL